MDPIELARRTGQPVPAPKAQLDASDLVQQIAQGLAKLSGKITDGRRESVTSHLAGVLQNIQADLKSLDIDNQIKARAQAALEAAAAADAKAKANAAAAAKAQADAIAAAIADEQRRKAEAAAAASTDAGTAQVAQTITGNVAQ